MPLGYDVTPPAQRYTLPKTALFVGKTTNSPLRKWGPFFLAFPHQIAGQTPPDVARPATLVGDLGGLCRPAHDTLARGGRAERASRVDGPQPVT